MAAWPYDRRQGVVYAELEEAIKQVLGSKGLQTMPKQMQKILQLHEALNQRMGEPHTAAPAASPRMSLACALACRGSGAADFVGYTRR